MLNLRDTFGDCEFVRKDVTPRGLISVGLCDTDGNDYYAVNAEVDLDALLADTFLRTQVWPHLPRTPAGLLDAGHPDVKTIGEIRQEVAAYYAGGPKARMWAYYGAGDLIRIHALWDHDWDLMPAAVPQRVREIADPIEDFGITNIPAQTTSQHHALNDAHYNRLMHQTVLQELGQQPSPQVPAMSEESLRALIASALRRTPVPGRGRTPRELIASIPESVEASILAFEPRLAELHAASRTTRCRYDAALATWVAALAEGTPPATV
ncbi:hypothetical protein [Streptomyces europaeiscabiei]|uniref:hypothetical protein n=1 Tax=Streptomyces europaeiscabiei TaxID=146819 RepID=UPI0038F6FDC4